MLIIFVCIDFNDKVDMWSMSLQIQNYVGYLNILILLIDEIRENLSLEMNSKSIVAPKFDQKLLDLKDVHLIILSQVFFSISRSGEGKQTFLNSGPYVINAK